MRVTLGTFDGDLALLSAEALMSARDAGVALRCMCTDVAPRLVIRRHGERGCMVCLWPNGGAMHAESCAFRRGASVAIGGNETTLDQIVNVRLRSEGAGASGPKEFNRNQATTRSPSATGSIALRELSRRLLDAALAESRGESADTWRNRLMLEVDIAGGDFSIERQPWQQSAWCAGAGYAASRLPQERPKLVLGIAEGIRPAQNGRWQLWLADLVEPLDMSAAQFEVIANTLGWDALRAWTGSAHGIQLFFACALGVSGSMVEDFSVLKVERK